MRASEIVVLKRYASRFQPQIPKFKEGRYVQIIVLRETKSHAIFTTEGQALHVERMPAGIRNSTPIKRVVMYKRKQIAPERRAGKALLRQSGLCPSQNVKDRDGRTIVPKGECQIVRQACGVCPDCILYGSVVTSGRRVGSQRSRVLTDSGFVVRRLSQVARSVKLNAIAETTNGGIVSGAYSHRENLMPEIFLPTVETLVDVTKEEFVYVMGNILKTTRYGAESGREGFVRNHIAGVYFSDVEIFSNLEMSQLFYDILSTNESIPDSLSLRDFTGNLAKVTDECMKKAVGCITMMMDEEISELIRDIRTIYSDQQSLREFLRTLSKMSMTYANQMRNTKDEQYALVEM